MPSQKRKLPSKVAKMQARKKAKLTDPEVKPAAAKPKVKGQSIRADELAWKEIELPEGLDDLEGFYGLEEIDGVDIIKDENGTLSFAAADGVDASSKTRKRGQNVGDARPDPFPAFIEGVDADGIDGATVNGKEARVGEDENEDAEEWDGFSDEADEAEKLESQEEDEDEWEDAEDDEEIDEEDAASEEAETLKLRQLLKQMTENAGEDFDDEEWPSEEESDGPEIEEFDEEGNLVDEDEADDEPDEQDAEAEVAAPPNKKQSKSKSAKSDPDELLGTSGSFSALQEEGEGEAEELNTAAWQTLGLLPATLSGLAKLGFQKPTDIQRATIPRINKGQDVIGKAPTGSGKTLAYGIPIFEYWLETQASSALKANGETKSHTALIVAPTRELAKQIDDHITVLVKNALEKPPRIATLTGGLSIQKQKRLLSVADIVIATPGRLWEIITEVKGVLAPLQAIRFLVLDEADRLLSAGHFQEISQILAALDRKGPDAHDADDASSKDDATRQTLVFSATFAQSLSQSLTHNKRTTSIIGNDEMTYLLRKLNFRSAQPAFIDVNPQSSMAPTLREALLQLPAGTQKDLYLYALLLYRPTSRILVFVNSINAARRIVPFLTNLGIDAQPLHSQMMQKARLSAIEKFSGTSSSTKKPGAAGYVWKGHVLVATDVAARGLDIPAVDIVLHYHVPRAADTYVHRSGRTARAENEGSSVLICAPEEAAGVRRLVAKVHASNEASGKRKRNTLEPLHIDRQLISRLRPRAVLAKSIADAEMAKEKSRAADRAVAEAADDLGIQYDSDGELETELEGGKKMTGKSGRGKKRKEMEKEARSMTKAEVRSKRAELKALLGERVNTGVSARYLTSGGVDIEKLLRERESGGGMFLGELPELGFNL